MQLSIRDAARQIGLSKSTLLRAIRVGKLSAERTEDGGFRVDPSELHRVFGAPREAPRGTAQDGAGNGAAAAAGAALDAVEWRVRAVSVEAELRAVRELLEAEKHRGEEIRQEREHWRGQADSWKTQAERLLLAPAIVTAAPNVTAPSRRSWWSFWRPAGRL